MLSLEALKRFGLVEVSPIFKKLSQDLSIKELSDLAYNLREQMQLTRDDLAEIIGVSSEELFNLELTRIKDQRRAFEITRQIQTFKSTAQRTKNSL